MHKKSVAIAVLSVLLLLPATGYSQKTGTPAPDASPAKTGPAATDYSSLPPARIIDKLQDQIITWQDDIIRGMEQQTAVQLIYRDMIGIAVNPTTGEVKNQKILDLLTKYGIGISTKDGKKLNSVSDVPAFLKITPETVPFVEVKDGASREEKARIRALLEKGQTLVDKATQAKQITLRLETVTMDLLLLSKTDEGAQSLVDKYSIKQHSSSPTPSPAPTP